jgi:hypothetical protein
MIHNVGNINPVLDEKLIVQNGDTFRCNCNLEKNFNSWKFEREEWYFLKTRPTSTKEGEWILETASIPQRDFNPSRR